MENASKALIIAGAILISILLIAISMYVYNAAQGTISEAGSQMSKQEKDMYNAAFLNYVGVNKKGVDARALIDAIISSNNNYIGDSGKFVALETASLANTSIQGVNSVIGTAGNPNNDENTVSTQSSSMSAVKAAINTGKKYDIEATYSSTGLITKLKITEKNASSGSNPS